MNYLDIIIIYLACGSPFGVYFFINSKPKNSSTWLKSILIAVVWIPFAVKLFHQKITGKLNNEKKDSKTEIIQNLQKNFENYLPTKSIDLSLFGLREIIERYSELTLISSQSNGIPAKHEKEIYRISGNDEFEISAICLNRRNHLRLLSHQISARRDFIRAIKILLDSNSDTKKLSKDTVEFVKILNDEEALSSINDLLKEFWQTDKTSAVKQLEKDLWTPTEQKLSNGKQISIPLQTMSLTTNVPKKD